MCLYGAWGGSHTTTTSGFLTTCSKGPWNILNVFSTYFEFL